MVENHRSKKPVTSTDTTSNERITVAIGYIERIYRELNSQSNSFNIPKND